MLSPAGVLLLWLIGVVPALPAQESTAQKSAAQDSATQGWQQRLDAAEALRGEARREACARLYADFARIPAADPRYRSRRRQGAWAAREAGRLGAAAALLREEWQQQGPSAGLFAERLEVQRRAGAWERVLALAYAERERFATEGAALFRYRNGAEFVAVAEAAGRLLLRDQELGLWCFARQAEILPKVVVAQANLALALRQLGQLKRARAAYERALAQAPRDAILWSDYALLLKGSGEIEAAGAALRRALKVEQPPGDSPAGTNLGVLFLRSGKTLGRDPVADLVQVLTARPKAALARRLLLDCLAR